MRQAVDAKTLMLRLYEAVGPTWAHIWRRTPPPQNDVYEQAVSATLHVLSEVGALGDWRHVNSLLNLLTHKDQIIRDGAARAITDSLSRMPATELPELDTRVRTSTLQASSWHELNASDVAGRPWATSILAVLSMHPSGHVRENAIREISRRDDAAKVVSFLVLRVNDWVPQVRKASRETLQMLLDRGDPEPWIASLGLLDRIAKRQRVDHAWLMHAVERLVLDEKARPSLIAAAASNDAGVSRWATRVAMRLPECDRLSVLSRALASTDPFTRMVAATHVREASAGQDRAALLAIMDRDPLASIRRQALYARLDADRATRDACLHAALLDRHRSMRHAGRFYLSEAVDDSGPRFDAPEFYRRAIASSGSRTLAAAIAGLGECGTRSDATLVARFASDAKPSVAAAAVRALARLDPDSHRDDFIRWMADHRSKVTREAYHAVMALGSAIDVSQVRDAMAKAASPLAKRLALRVLVSRHPYDAVVDAIIAAADPCTPLAADAARYIKSLREHSATYGATVAQKAAVVNAVASVGDRLDVSLRDHALRVIGVSRP